MKKTEISAGGGLSTGTRIGFGVGDFGANLIFQSTFIFLIFFFTDVFGIAAPVAGTIFLIAKAWDGVSDPIVGYLSDRTRTRWGKKRPYLLFGAIPLGVFSSSCSRRRPYPRNSRSPMDWSFSSWYAAFTPSLTSPTERWPPA